MTGETVELEPNIPGNKRHAADAIVLKDPAELSASNATNKAAIGKVLLIAVASPDRPERIVITS